MTSDMTILQTAQFSCTIVCVAIASANDLHSHHPVDTRASAVPFKPLPGEMRLQLSLTYRPNWAKGPDDAQVLTNQH